MMMRKWTATVVSPLTAVGTTRRRPLCSAAAAVARPLRTFQVERYPGWTDGSDSLSSSETEPLSMHELLSHADEEGLERWRSLSLGYASHNEGSPFLRREILATQYLDDAAAGALLDEGHVNVVTPAEGIYLASRALLAPGDHVVATTPLYQSLGEVARSIGCEVSAWRPVDLDRRPRFDPAGLAALLRPGKTRLVIANFPHNPTGALPTATELDEVIAQCDAAGCHLLIDEMYRHLEHDGPAARLRAAATAYHRGISLAGVSKTIGLPGLRIGWVASQDSALMARIAQLKDYSTICPPSPSEALAAIALRAQPRLLERSRAIVARGLAAAREVVARHPERLVWAEPRGGTFCFVRLREEAAAAAAEAETAASSRSSEAYCDALRARAGLMLMPGALFDVDGASASDAAQRVRLTYGRAGTAELLERWSEDLSIHGIVL